MNNQPERKKILLLEDDSFFADLFRGLIEEAEFECVWVRSISAFWQTFDPREFIALIVDNEVVGGSFIDENNITRIREMTSEMPIALNSGFSQKGVASKYKCEETNKDLDKLRDFLRKLQIYHTPHK